MASKLESQNVIDLTDQSDRVKNSKAATTPRLSCDDTAIVSADIIGLVKEAAIQQNNENCSNTTAIVYLESNNSMVHIQQTDKWSCGFRNLQMVLASLLSELSTSHSYYSHNSNIIPSVSQLQGNLEQAWKDGWDPSGAQHYGRKIVHKSSKIGAVEVSTILSYLGIDNTIVQFIKCRESRSQLGRFCQAYFCDAFASNATSHAIVEQLLGDKKCGTNRLGSNSPKQPLYLQWDGHSVCIVGVELTAAGRCKNLLVLDPIVSGDSIRTAVSAHDWKPMLLSLARLERRDCQIIVVSALENQQPPRRGAISAQTAAPDAVLKSLRQF